MQNLKLEMLLKKLEKENIINPPDFLTSNTMFLCVSGSSAYGMSTNKSDIDLVGFCIPPKHYIFPHLTGEINGFGTPSPRFEQYIKHHIQYDGKEYDVTVFNIVKFFQMCFEGNPNSIDMLFSSREDILHSTIVAEKVYNNRQMFLSKRLVPKLKGYAYAQLSKLGRENYEKSSKRYELTQRFGYDVKKASHVYRLLLQCEMLLEEGTLDLKRNSETLLRVRAGEYSLSQVKDFFLRKESRLNELVEQSKLPECPNEFEIKKLLLECIEYHYGSIKDLIVIDKYINALNEVRSIVNKL